MAVVFEPVLQVFVQEFEFVVGVWAFQILFPGGVDEVRRDGVVVESQKDRSGFEEGAFSY